MYEIFKKATRGTIAQTEYEMVEAKAAPEIPQMGMKIRLRGTFIPSETIAAMVPIIGFPLPISSLHKTLLTLIATTPGNKI